MGIQGRRGGFRQGSGKLWEGWQERIRKAGNGIAVIWTGMAGFGIGNGIVGFGVAEMKIGFGVAGMKRPDLDWGMVGFGVAEMKSPDLDWRK